MRDGVWTGRHRGAHPTKGEDEMFYVYFRGTNYGRWIEAENLKSAKWIFALQEGINGINQIAGKRKN